MKDSSIVKRDPLKSSKNGKSKSAKKTPHNDFDLNLANKIIESTHTLIVGLDKNHIIKKFNTGAEKITGYSRQEVIGKDWFHIFFPNEIYQEMESVWEKAWGIQSHSYINPILHKTGQKLIISWQSTGIYDDEDDSKHLLISIGKDITASTLIEDQINKLSAAVKQSPSIIVITDKAGKIEYVNPKFSIITGYSAQEVIGQTPRLLKSGYHLPEIYDKLWQIISMGGEWRGEFKNKKKNGDLFWESASISPIYNQQGKITNYVKVAEDISDKKKTELIQNILYNIANAAVTTKSIEEFISHIQRELSAIINTSNFYIAFYDKQDDSLSFPYYSDSNDKFTKASAYKSLSKIVLDSGSSLLADMKVKKKLLEEGKLLNHGSLSKVWLGVPLKSKKSTIGVLAVQDYENENAYDSTDQLLLEFIADQISLSLEMKNTEMQLKESENRFRNLFDELGDAVYVTMIEGKKRGKILEANQAASIQTGYSKDELLQMNIVKDICVANSAELDMVTWNQKLDAGERIKSKEKKRKKDGTEFWTEVVLTPFTYKGIRASLSINRDITERIEAENKLKEALEKAKESEELKSAFLANMSHEIRTPLNGIIGFTALLKEPGLSQEEIEMYTDVIDRSGDRLLNTVNNLIDISKLESGQMKVINSKVNINEQLENLYLFFKQQAEDKGLLLSHHTELDKTSSVIVSDLEKFYGIFTNLINNAIKYTSKGSVDFGYHLKDERETRQIEFYVQDTGMGIPKNIHHNIFDRFVQADLSLSSKYEGAGLGLSITKAYIELLHGRIWVESEEGVGSTFYFTIQTK